MHPSSTSSPWVPYFMCSRVLLPPGRFGPLRAEVGVGFRRVRLVQALLSSPPPLVLFRCPSASAFLFPCLFRVCPFRARCVVLVFSLSLFFCVPLFASWLSNFHLIFIFTSSSFPFFFIFISSYRALIVPPSCGRVCVCVNHLKRCKTSTADFIRFYSISCRGAVNLIPSTAQRRRWFEIVISDIGTDHPDVPANFQFPFCRQWQPAKPRTGMSIFCSVSRFTALLSQSVFLSCQ